MKNRSAVAKRSAPDKQSSPRFRFIGDIIAELKKVVWLTRQETIYLTGMVLVVAIIMALLLGVIDYGFTRLVNDLFLA
ncbi:preprotein translocase subunit SecE [Chloroflexota bacterium]